MSRGVDLIKIGVGILPNNRRSESLTKLDKKNPYEVGNEIMPSQWE